MRKYYWKNQIGKGEQTVRTVSWSRLKSVLGTPEQHAVLLGETVKVGNIEIWAIRCREE